jgi:uncharacterized protein (TIGR03084 family)
MNIFDDLAAEQERLEKILAGLEEAQWMSASGAAGWTVADVVLHLAQTEELVQASVTGRQLRTGFGAAAGAGSGTGSGTGSGAAVGAGSGAGSGGAVDELADLAVRMERAAPAEVFGRWQAARQAAMAALRAADPQQPVPWVAGTMKPGTLATTRLAEHWAHGLDITGPLGIEFPDTARLRHVAWLAHRTLPYALTQAGQQPAEVRVELTAPDGSGVWEFGPVGAESSITGPAGDFCRVAARRLDPASTALKATGPHGATALRLVRSYA